MGLGMPRPPAPQDCGSSPNLSPPSRPWKSPSQEERGNVIRGFQESIWRCLDRVAGVLGDTVGEAAPWRTQLGLWEDLEGTAGDGGWSWGSFSCGRTGMGEMLSLVSGSVIPTGHSPPLGPEGAGGGGLWPSKMAKCAFPHPLGLRRAELRKAQEAAGLTAWQRWGRAWDTLHAGGDCHLWRLGQVKGSQAGTPLWAQCCGVRALGGAHMTFGGPSASTGTEVRLLMHRGGARKLALAGAGGPVPGDCTSGGLTSPLTRPSPRSPARSAARTPRLTPVSPPLPCTQPAPRLSCRQEGSLPQQLWAQGTLGAGEQTLPATGDPSSLAFWGTVARV